MTDSRWDLTGSVSPGTAASDPKLGGYGDGFLVLRGSNLGANLLGDWIGWHTGGDAGRLIAIACSGSGSLGPLKSTEAPEIGGQSLPRDPEEALTLIQSTFGLSITGLANVLRVERPTIYAWLRAQSTPTEPNRTRIERVANLAAYWLSRSGGAPLKELRAKVLNDKSLLDLLLEEHLRTFAAETAMREIGRRLTSGRERRPTLREIARSRGISKDSVEYDALTGRRFTEED